jgi:hypothetical protein
MHIVPGLSACARSLIVSALILTLTALAAPAWAARHALVIGNNAYPGNELRSAVNDARDVAAALKQSGFEILLRENATRDGMFQAIQEFGGKLRDGDVALFYFAGHAIQVRDRNYLIPVDAKVKQEDDVTFYSLDVAEVLQRMDRARTRANLLILDACRDNPFSSTVRFSSVGLAQMSAPPGTLIAYATAPGQVAREGTGRNGVFTKHLLRHMSTANQPVELTLKRVREGVLADTKGQQVPWDSSSLRGDIVFAGEAAQPGVTVAAVSSPSVDTRMNVERTFWESIKDSRDPKEFDAYIQQFPDGVFAMLARGRLQQLQNAEAAANRTPGPAGAPATAAPGLAAAAAPVGSVAPAPAPSAPLPATASAASAPPPAAAAPAVSATAVSATAGTSTGSAAPGATAPPPAPAAAPPAAPQPALALAAGGVRSVGGPAAAAAQTIPAAPAAQAIPAPASAPAPQAQQLALATPRADPSALAPKVLSDGSTFQGELLDGRLHGRGKLISKTAGEYHGDFVQGVREGQGEQRWPNGDRYVGQFKADRPEGQGVMDFANGDRYEGSWAGGVFSGPGKLVAKSGFQYEGDFAAGRRQGSGKAVFPEGNRYTGEFANDLPQGRGQMAFADGGQYEGEFSAGVPAGKGQYRFANGSRYVGAFQAGAMSGLGVFHYPNGDRLEGQFDKGAASGAGVHFFAAGGRFEGEFTDQGQNARGFMIDPAGLRKPARLENGQFKSSEG